MDIIDNNLQKEIICTLGPSSMNDWVIKRFEDLGVILFRINLSHTKLKDLAQIIDFVQNRTKVPICLDTEGAQIRTGDLKDKKVFLKENSIVSIHRRRILGDKDNFNLYPEFIIDKFEVGDLISIDFNSVLGQIIEKKSDCFVMRILTGGFMGQNKAVSTERDINTPPLSHKDREALMIGTKMGIYTVALSFANQASDVDEIRSFLSKDSFVFSKIESIKGVINFEEIAARSNAIILDRGDLSRQIPIEQIPKVQKDVISRAKEAEVKIYVATNLLESMISSPTPTRAEVNDIFNTLNDGADGLVLAAESAIGSYPVKCATMVSKIIKQFTDVPDRSSVEEMYRKEDLLLVEPHGGVLVNRMIDDFCEVDFNKYKKISVHVNNILDAEQIAIGTFSPLEGFMTKVEVESVLSNYRLPNGVIWPLPIVLQTTEDEASKLNVGEIVALELEHTGEIYALLQIEDIYTYDLDSFASEMFGTTNKKHAGVNYIKQRGNYFLGGKIELVKRFPSKYKYFEITPRQARMIFENKGWSRVVGFHTRNVIHRVHEHIQMKALKDYHCDGLFVHPVVGPKKRGDFTVDAIVKSYDLMTRKHYPKERVVLGAFQSYSRYAGPQEAVFTALCRKNFGCSHFIVGRDHTGIENYYTTDDSHKLFNKLGDIGIVPIYFNEMSYCKKCRAYVEDCSHDNEDILRISGTECRKILQAGKRPPDWFMRKSISFPILDEMKNGNGIFSE